MKRKTMMQVYVSTRKKIKDLAKAEGKHIPTMAEDILDIGIKNFVPSGARRNAHLAGPSLGQPQENTTQN